MANELEQILGCKLKTFPFTYLGIPLSDKKLPRSAYLPLIEKMNAKLAGWAARFLSIAGRLVLLNSILSSMPMHYMSVIRLPDWVINEIDKIRRRFLWKGASEQGKGYHLVDWQKVCKPKDIGGLGILDMRIFNQSLLLKWIWWWHKNEQRIWKPIMQMEPLDVSNIPTAPIFKQVNMEIVSFFNNSTIFIPGDGSRILVWEHNWGYGILKHRLQYVYSYALQPQLTLWQLATSQEITTNFRPNMSDEALSELQIIRQWILITNLQPMIADETKWNWTTTGEFTVHSAYRALKTGPCIDTDIKHIWSLRAPPRMLIFSWLTYYNKILTHDNLRKRGIEIVSRCTLCRAHNETVRHLFRKCPYTKQVYSELKASMASDTWPHNPVLNIVDTTIRRRVTKGQKTAILIMNFVIWRERCARSFTEQVRTTIELVQDTLQQLEYIKQRERDGNAGMAQQTHTT